MTQRRLGLLVLACAIVVVGLAFGTRQSLGLFMRPITLDLGWGRESLSLVLAVQALLNGLAAPFAGAISDRWGTGRTVAGGAVLYGIGLAFMASARDPVSMMLGGGLLVGMGISACGMPVMLAAVARIAPEDKQSLWLGLVTAGATGGQLAIIPGTRALLDSQGWSVTLLVLGACFALLLPMAACLGLAGRSRPRETGDQTLTQALREARAHRGFVMLTIGFFVCGFQVQFVATHLPAFIEDSGLPVSLTATSLVVIAFCNMVGAWYAGFLGGRRRKRTLLAGIYLCRAVLIVAFLSVPVSTASVLAFSAVMGFLWLGTVPLTSGLVAQIFGRRYMATLYAIVYLSHQAGNFTGAWLGGRLHDATGSYDVAWWIAAGLGVIACVMHTLLDDRPVERMREAAQPG